LSNFCIIFFKKKIVLNHSVVASVNAAITVLALVCVRGLFFKIKFLLQIILAIYKTFAIIHKIQQKSGVLMKYTIDVG